MITGYVFDGIKGFNVPNYVFENLVTTFSLFAPSIERRISLLSGIFYPVPSPTVSVHGHSLLRSARGETILEIDRDDHVEILSLRLRLHSQLFLQTRIADHSAFGREFHAEIDDFSRDAVRDVSRQFDSPAG